MLEDAWQGIGWMLGLDEDSLNVWQMAVRAVVVYIAAVVMVRLGEKRFMGKNTAFDVILGIILGSVVSRAITGSAPFFPSIGAGFVLVGVHWLFARIAFHFDRFGTLIKGENRILIKDGELQWKEMRNSNISENDLREMLRLKAGTDDPGQVKIARLERNGEMSVITKVSATTKSD